METAARGVRAERNAFRASLEGNRLLLDRDTLRAIEREMEAAYPGEGLGYVAVDGARLSFIGVKNALAGSELAHSFGIHDEADLARVHWLIAKTDQDLLGKVHSHPDASPVFSDGDLMGVSQLMALAPDFRMIIDGVTRNEDGRLVHRIASFVGGSDGQVRAEDTVEAH
jgi:proteasome lid subunit RPN8/RPN11